MTRLASFGPVVVVVAHPSEPLHNFRASVDLFTSLSKKKDSESKKKTHLG